MSKQADYKVDLLNNVTSHKHNIHIHRRIRTNDPWSPRATYVLSVPGIVVAAAAETPCGLVMCANCNPVYFKQMACFSTLCNTISLNISVNDKSLFFSAEVQTNSNVKDRFYLDFKFVSWTLLKFFEILLSSTYHCQIETRSRFFQLLTGSSQRKSVNMAKKNATINWQRY